MIGGMGKLGAALAAALWLLLSMPTPAQAQSMVSVNRNEINMRTGAGTSHEAVWGLSRGYPLKVLGRKGSWYHVRDFEGDEGWVYRPLTARKPHHVVKVTTANMRSSPSTRARIVGKAHYGEVLRTLGHKKGWVKVRHDNGRVGWVARRLLWGW